MDTNLVDLHVAIARLQAVVEAGFTGVKEEFEATHERLDKLNGRVYTGEKERADLAGRISVLQSRQDYPSSPSTTPAGSSDSGSKLTLIGMAAGVSGGVAGTLIALWEFLKPFLSSLPPTPPPQP